MKRVVILSDTHGVLHPEVLARLRQADVILHAGDLDTPEVADAIYRCAPAYLVQGNNDRWWAPHMPRTVSVTIEGVRFFMLHSERVLSPAYAGADVVVCGHTHRYRQEQRGAVLWLNPGSCGCRRWDPELTFCVMEVEEGRYHLEKVSFPPPVP